MIVGRYVSENVGTDVWVAVGARSAHPCFYTVTTLQDCQPKHGSFMPKFTRFCAPRDHLVNLLVFVEL